MEKLIIIGAGPAGYTAAIYAARANLEPLMLAGDTPGGLLTQTTEVENFPGFPNGVIGPDLMFQMQEQAEKFGAKVDFSSVTFVELNEHDYHKVTLNDGRVITTKALIIATGASPRTLGIDAEKKYKNRGLSACATCDGAFYADKVVAVIGGGDSAMEEAVFLTRFASKVYVIHRRNELRATPIMAERAQKNPKIEFIWNSVVTDIYGESNLEGLVIKNNETNQNTQLPCSACFIALGHTPNTALFQDDLCCDANNYILLAAHTAETSIRGVFAAGDCADPHYRQAITAAGMGCRAAMDAERFLR